MHSHPKSYILHGPSDLELIVISIQTGSHNNVCVGVFFYRPCTIIIINFIFDTLLDSLFSIDHSYFYNLVLLSDFNVNVANPDYQSKES